MDVIVGLALMAGVAGVWVVWIIWRWWHQRDLEHEKSQHLFGTPAEDIIERLSGPQPVVQKYRPDRIEGGGQIVISSRAPKVFERRGGYPSAAVPREQLPRLPESAISKLGTSEGRGWRFVEDDSDGSIGRHRIERKDGIEMSQCEYCGDPVMYVTLARNYEGPSRELCLNVDPDPAKGTVIVFGNPAVCRYLDGSSDWATVQEFNLPVYVRHRLYCRRFWGQKVFDREGEA